MAKQVIKEKMEFSKKILIVSYAMAILMILYVCWLAYLGTAISDLTSIVLACMGEVTAGNGFYYWKARTENKIKMTQGSENIIFNIDKDS